MINYIMIGTLIMIDKRAYGPEMCVLATNLQFAEFYVYFRI